MQTEPGSRVVPTILGVASTTDGLFSIRRSLLDLKQSLADAVFEWADSAFYIVPGYAFAPSVVETLCSECRYILGTRDTPHNVPPKPIRQKLCGPR